MPAMPASHSRRVYSIFTQLPELLERVKTLEQQVEQLDVLVRLRDRESAALRRYLGEGV